MIKTVKLHNKLQKSTTERNERSKLSRGFNGNLTPEQSRLNTLLKMVMLNVVDAGSPNLKALVLMILQKSSELEEVEFEMFKTYMLMANFKTLVPRMGHMWFDLFWEEHNHSAILS